MLEMGSFHLNHFYYRCSSLLRKEVIKTEAETNIKVFQQIKHLNLQLMHESKTVPVKYEVDQSLQCLKHLCNDKHPCHIFYPKESPLATYGP